MRKMLFVLIALLASSAVSSAFTVPIAPVIPVVVDDLSDITVVSGTNFDDWHFFGSSDRTLNTLDVGGSGYTPSMRLFISDGNRAAASSSFSNTTKKMAFVGSSNLNRNAS